MTQVPLENLTPRQRQAYILRFGRGWRLRRIAVELGMWRENGVARNGAPCCAGSPDEDLLLCHGSLRLGDSA
jgi:hypothetical protein